MAELDINRTWIPTSEIPLPPYDPRSGIPEWIYGHEAEIANQIGEEGLLKLLYGGGTNMAAITGNGGVYPRYFVQDNGDGTFSLVQEYAAGGFTKMHTGTRSAMEQLYNQTVGAATTPAATGAVGTSDVEQWAKNMGISASEGYAFVAKYGRLPNSIAELEAFRGGTAPTGGTGATAFLNANPDIRNHFFGQGWPQTTPDTTILTEWLKIAGNDSRVAAGKAALGGGYQLEPSTYEKSLFSGQNIPSMTGTIGAGTPTVGAPSWFEEQQPGAFLPYLMQQRGIGLGTPLASYMQAQAPSAERAFQFATTAAQAGGQTAPNWTEFLPAWTQNRQGTPSVSQLMGGAQQATAGDPYWAALFGEGGLTAAQQMQLMAEAQKPGMTGPFLRWLMSNAAPALQQQWQMQVPTAAQPGTSFMQYALGRGGY